MEDKLVEWNEKVTPEVYEFLNKLYNNYTEIETGKPMDKPDFNGCVCMFMFYKFYIDKVEAGEITEIEKLPLLKAIENCLECSKKIHLTEILY